MNDVKENTKEEVSKIEEEKRKKNEAMNIRNEARKKALVQLKEFFDKNPNKECIESLKTLRPSLYGIYTGGGGRASGGTPIYKKVIDKIVEAGGNGLEEMTLFRDFKIGRKETAGMIKRSLKSSEPQDRVWINFTPSDGKYKVIGKGPVAPANYTGYIPIDETVEVSK
jgi:hypothetical protein